MFNRDGHYQKLKRDSKEATTRIGVVTFKGTTTTAREFRFDASWGYERETAEVFYQKLEKDPDIEWVLFRIIHIEQNLVEVVRDSRVKNYDGISNG